MPLGKGMTRRITPGTLTRRETTLAAVSPMRSSSAIESGEYSESRSKRNKSTAVRTPKWHNSDDQRLENEEKMKRAHLKLFITENFKRKECHEFIAKQDNVQMCHCGATLEQHYKHATGTSEFLEGKSSANNDFDKMKPGKKWEAKRCVKEVTTNAFGEINFINETSGGHKPAKFVRMSDETDVDDALVLMENENYWNMNYPFPPNLIITVIGGAKNFRLDGKKKEVFNSGLVKAAQSTHAWIITSGCNMGVMKAVGEAVEERQTYQWDNGGYTHTLRCIGIPPWGYVERKELLLRKDNTLELENGWHKTYPASNKILPMRPVSLNPNHTHFLMVDDGVRGLYTGVAGFRARLERRLAERGKHVLLLVVEGGTDAIIDASTSLSNGIPVVLCEGTGRAADILAYAYAYSKNKRSTEKSQMMASPHHEKQLKELIMTAYSKTWITRKKDVDGELKKIYDMVLKCCENKPLVSVFDMNKDEELDVAMLGALLKGQGAGEKDTSQLLNQLNLALTWNRSDVAEEQIFNKDINWGEKQLDETMTKALKDDKVNFVKLLLNNGVIMKTFLTVDVLRNLYQFDTNNHLFMYNLLKTPAKKAKVTLRTVHNLLKRLKMRYDNEWYEDDVPGETEVSKTFTNPFRELFIWAVLTNRHEMAKFLWERGDMCISSALAATQIYFSMAERVEQFDMDLKEEFMKNKEEFEHLAVKVLDQCHYTHPENAAEILERKCPKWHNMTCLEIAAQSKDREFLSSVACQTVLDSAWNRGVNVHWLKLGLCILCPLFIPCLVEFVDDLETKSPCGKFLYFYRAPMVKFAANMISYMLFLLGYSYMLLFEYSREIGILEIIIQFWILTMILEEIREMFFLSNADNVMERLKVWWNFSTFNRMDLVIIFVSILGFVLRVNGEGGTYRTAKTVYCINCVLFFVRVLSFYSASSYLGPKLVMIARMVQELLLYILILAVFLLAYGVATLALQYPTRKPYTLVLRDIFYYPYWQIYGELFLDELEGTADECSGNGTGLMADGNPCPEFNWLVPALTALYLLIGNVLLLNLLIAIFTNVFEEVNTNSIQIWKFGMYFLVVEYQVKPTLAPPLVIFEHFVLGIQWLRWHCFDKKPQEDQQLMVSAHSELLDIFEREMQKAYLMRCISDETNNIELKINRIHHRVDEVTKLLKAEQMLSHQNMSAGLMGEHRPGLQRRVTSQANSLLMRQDTTASLFSDDNSGPEISAPSSSKPPELSPIKEQPSPRKEQNIAPFAKPNIDEDDDLKKPGKDSFKNLVDITGDEDPYGKYDFNKFRDVEDTPGYDRLPADTKAKGRSDSERETVTKPGTSRARKDADVQQPYNTESEDEKPPRKAQKKKKKNKKKKYYVESSDDNMQENDKAQPVKHIEKAPPPQRGYRHDVHIHDDAVPSEAGHLTSRSAAGESDMERRMADVERNTQAQLGNIEILLRNMMFQQPSRGAVPPTAFAASHAQPQLPRQPVEFPPDGSPPLRNVGVSRNPFSQAFGAPNPVGVYGVDNAAFTRPEATYFSTGAPLGGGLHRPSTASPSQQQRGARY